MKYCKENSTQKNPKWEVLFKCVNYFWGLFVRNAFKDGALIKGGGLNGRRGLMEYLQQVLAKVKNIHQGSTYKRAILLLF